MLKVKRERWITQIKDLNRRMVHFFEQNEAKKWANDNWLFYIAWGKKPERCAANASVTRPAQ